MKKDIKIELGPGVCDKCGEIVYHISAFCGETNHPHSRATLCPGCGHIDEG